MDHGFNLPPGVKNHHIDELFSRMVRCEECGELYYMSQVKAIPRKFHWPKLICEYCIREEDEI